MLNELYDLSLSLERAGVVPAEWHPDLKELPKVSNVKPCFKVYLAQDGAIIEIESIEDSAQIESLRKWQSGGNGYSFPCFNVRPLFKIYAGSGAEASEKKKFDDWLNGLKKTQVLSDDAATTLECYADNGNALWGVEDKKRVATCLDSIPSKLNAMLGEPPDEYRAMTVLIERCRKTTADNFFQTTWRFAKRSYSKLSKRLRQVRGFSAAFRYESAKKTIFNLFWNWRMDFLHFHCLRQIQKYTVGLISNC